MQLSKQFSSDTLQVKADLPDCDEMISRLSLCLYQGAAQAIALAKCSNGLLLIDEKMGRATAERLQAWGYRYSTKLVGGALLLGGEY